MTSIRFENLKQSLKETVFPVYLVEGEDAFFRSRSVELIKKAVLSEPDLNLSRFDGAQIKADVGQLIMDLRSFPFMSEYRVVEVVDWQPTVADIKGEIKDYLSAPNDKAVLIVVNKAKCENLKKFDGVCVVDCSKADLDVITKYIRYKATAAKLIVSNSVCRKIAEYCLYDMSKIDKETDKLIDYLLGSSEITDDAVEKMVTKDVDYKIYQLTGFIAAKNYDKAYDILKDVTTPSDKQQIFVSLYYHLRRMFYASVYRGSDKELAAYLGDKEYPVKVAREQSAHFSAKRLKNIVEHLSALDGDFKSGRISVDSAYDLALFDVLSGETR